MLADVHSGNMGRAVLEEYDEPQAVITDPGHMIVLPGAKISTPKMIGGERTQGSTGAGLRRSTGGRRPS